jgi:hypothetical protein
MSKLETNTIDTVSGTTNLTIGSTNTSSITLGASGDTITVPNGALSGQNYPAFKVAKSSNQDVTAGATVKVTWDSVIYDTDSAFASDKFTVPSGKGGKYFIHAKVWGDAVTASQWQYGDAFVYVNGASVSQTFFDVRNNTARQFSIESSSTYDLSAGDYVEIYGRVYDTSGTPRIRGTTTLIQSTFTGFRIGA